VTYSTAALQVSSGSYTATITPVDSYGNSGNPASFSFIISATSVTSVSVGGIAVGTNPNSPVTVFPFSLISFNLDAQPAYSISMTLTGPAGAVAGSVVIPIIGNTVRFAFAQQTTAGLYTATIIPKDADGNVGAPVSYYFDISSINVNVLSAAVGGAAISTAGGRRSAPLIPSPSR